MNLLSVSSRMLAAYRQKYPQYWMDMLVEQILRRRKDKDRELLFGQVLAVVYNHELCESFTVPGLNIITNAGDTYYAQSAAGESPTNDFDGASSGLRLGSANTTPVKTATDVTTFLSGTGHALDATYERTADPDTDNTGDGADIVTWRYSYATSEGNANGIQEGAIVDNRTTPTTALTHFLFASSFNKTSSDTLKVFVNHEFTGV